MNFYEILAELQVPDSARRIRKAQRLQLLNTRINMAGGISLFICAHIIYLSKPKLPQYLYSVLPHEEKWIPYLLLLALELYSKCIIMFWFAINL